MENKTKARWQLGNKAMKRKQTKNRVKKKGRKEGKSKNAMLNRGR